MKSKNNKKIVKNYTGNFYKGNKISLAFTLFITMCISLVSVLLSYLIQQIIDSINGTAGSASMEKLTWMTIFIILGCGICGTIYANFFPRFVKKAMYRYKTYVFDKILKKSMESFLDENDSMYLSALSNDANTIENDYIKSLDGLVENAVWFVGSFALMLWYSPILTLVAVFASLLPIVASLFTGGKVVKAEELVAERNQAFMGTLKDFLGGFSVVKSFKAEKEVGELFAKATLDAEGNKCHRNRILNIVQYTGMLSGVIAQLSVFLIGAYLSGQGKLLTPGIVMAFVNLMGLVAQPIVKLPELIAKRRAAYHLIERIALKLEEDTEYIGEDVSPILSEGIELKDVSFAYEDKKVLSNVNVKFEAGKSYAIVGGSGSGKSTLLNLIMGEKSSYTGEICYDRKDIRSISSKSIYDIVSLVQQNVFVFDSSIKDNITMFRPFSGTEIDRAIDLSGLRTLIDEKKEDYSCGENGKDLSGGERQRISIARALLRKAPVLLVDEATAALDARTAYHVSDSILNLKDLTRIVVTHSLDESLLRRYDSILVLKNGRIEEAGKFDELIDKGGYFHSLYAVAN